MVPVIRPQLSRRTALRLALAAGGSVLVAGCEEDPLPHRGTDDASGTAGVVPDDPATWPADTDLMLAARVRVHDHLQALGQVRSKDRARVRPLQKLWQAQLDTLSSVVSLGGVPLPTLPAAPSGAARTPAARVADELRSVLASAVADVARATPTNRPMLLSLAGQHAASAALLGGPVPWEPLAGPTGAAGVELLGVLRPAVYGLEVVAARSQGPERAMFESVLVPVASLTRQLTGLAGASAPVPPLGYDLPEPLADAAQRLALARSLVADLAPAALSTVNQTAPSTAVTTSLVRLVAEADGWRQALHSPAEPFPGMHRP